MSGFEPGARGASPPALRPPPGIFWARGRAGYSVRPLNAVTVSAASRVMERVKPKDKSPVIQVASAVMRPKRRQSAPASTLRLGRGALCRAAGSGAPLLSASGIASSSRRRAAAYSAGLISPRRLAASSCLISLRTAVMSSPRTSRAQAALGMGQKWGNRGFSAVVVNMRARVEGSV